MFDRLFRLFSHDVGIDLGTANILVYVKGHGIAVSEPAIVALNDKTGRLVAIGEDAKQMLGRTPAHITIVRPLIDGVISNFEVTEEILSHFLRRVSRLPPRKFFRPRVVIGVPTGITNVEARAVRDAARNAGAREVYIVEEPMAAAVGIKLPTDDPVGNLIVDLGGGTADIAVISLGGIVRSKNLRLGGDKLDRDIVSYIRDEFKILIGEKTAEEIKLTISAVGQDNPPLEAVIRGRDLVTGLPKEMVVTDSDIREAIGKSLSALIEAVKEVLETTPPEVVADVMRRGLVLVGGGSLLRGLPELLEHELRIPVRVADDPLTAVVRGTGVILEDLERFRDILTSDKDEVLSR